VTVDEPLHTIYFKLMQLIEGFEDLKLKGTFTNQEVGHLQNKLHSIDQLYQQAAFKKRGVVPAGQAVVTELLEEAHEIAYELVCKLPGDENTDSEARMGIFKVDKALRNVYAKLIKLFDDLDELNKNPSCTTRDLGLLQNQLNEIDQTYSEAAIHKGGAIPEGQAVVVEFLERAHTLAHEIAMKMETNEPTDEMYAGINAIDESLRGYYVKLLNVIEALEDLSKIEGFNSRDVGRLQNKIKKIDYRYNEAAFKKTKREIPAGQAIISELLDRAREKAHQLASIARPAEPTAQLSGLSEPMQRIYLKLLNVVDALDSLRHKDSVTTRDVGALQNKLNSIDDQYRQCVIKKAGQIPAGQALISEQLHEARELAHDILCNLPPSDADVDESLRGVYYKLSDIIEGFKALKEKGSFTGQEVGKLQNKLSQIDDLYKQAAIKKAGVVPNGQAIIADMLNEAHELAHELVCSLPDLQSDASSYSPIDEELTNLLFTILQLQDKPHLRRAEVVILQKKLREIEENVVEKRLDDVSIRENINQAYGMIYELIIELGPKKDLSAEIDEVLWPVEAELKKVIHALHELRKKPVKHIKDRDLRYAQDKLREVDELYAEGAFAKLLPMQEPLKGQAVLSSMLNKAHQMLYEISCRLSEEQPTD